MNIGNNCEVICSHLATQEWQRRDEEKGREEKKSDGKNDILSWRERRKKSSFCSIEGATENERSSVDSLFEIPTGTFLRKAKRIFS